MKKHILSLILLGLLSVDVSVAMKQKDTRGTGGKMQQTREPEYYQPYYHYNDKLRPQGTEFRQRCYENSRDRLIAALKKDEQIETIKNIFNEFKQDILEGQYFDDEQVFPMSKFIIYGFPHIKKIEILEYFLKQDPTKFNISISIVDQLNRNYDTMITFIDNAIKIMLNNMTEDNQKEAKSLLYKKCPRHRPWGYTLKKLWNWYQTT